MSVTLSTIRENVLKGLMVNSSDSTLQSRATRWINKSLDKIQFYIPEAEFLQNSNTALTTVADQATYSLPGRFKRPRGAVL